MDLKGTDDGVGDPGGGWVVRGWLGGVAQIHEGIHAIVANCRVCFLDDLQPVPAGRGAQDAAAGNSLYRVDGRGGSGDGGSGDDLAGRAGGSAEAGVYRADSGGNPWVEIGNATLS